MADDSIVVLTGTLKGASYPVESGVSIGRNPDNTIQTDDMLVSRRHAVVERAPGGGAVLRDLGSGNGTYVGNQRILEHHLADGEIFWVGKQQLQYRVGAEKAPMPKVTDSKVLQTEGEEKFESTDAQNIYQTFFQAPQGVTGEERLREIQRRLAAVYAANQAIASEQKLSMVFDRLMEQVFSLIPAHNGVILLSQEGKEGLNVEYTRSGIPGKDLHISSSIINRAFEKGEAVITCNALDDSRFRAGMSIISENISSAMCVPLTHHDERLGVLYVDNHGVVDAFNNSDLELLVALAGAAATAIKNAQYVRLVEQSYQDTLIVLANAIELRDHYTVGHTWRVTNFAMEIARELGWDEAKINEVQMGGVLHDVGKIAVDNSILGKVGKLTEEEFAQMKVHPERGADLLRDVKFLQPLIPYCLYHHERWDGTGYPFGLQGERIPIEGRLISVADAFDAMTSNRPYRKGLPIEVAVDSLQKGKATQFDATIVDALITALNKGRIAQVLQDYYKNEAHSIACPFCSTFVRLGEEVGAGGEVGCSVCHRRIRILESEGVYFGELLPKTDTGH